MRSTAKNLIYLLNRLGRKKEEIHLFVYLCMNISPIHRHLHPKRYQCHLGAPRLCWHHTWNCLPSLCHSLFCWNLQQAVTISSQVRQWLVRSWQQWIVRQWQEWLVKQWNIFAGQAVTTSSLVGQWLFRQWQHLCFTIVESLAFM